MADHNELLEEQKAIFAQAENHTKLSYHCKDFFENADHRPGMQIECCRFENSWNGYSASAKYTAERLYPAEYWKTGYCLLKTTLTSNNSEEYSRAIVIPHHAFKRIFYNGSFTSEMLTNVAAQLCTDLNGMKNNKLQPLVNRQIWMDDIQWKNPKGFRECSGVLLSISNVENTYCCERPKGHIYSAKDLFLTIKLTTTLNMDAMNAANSYNSRDQAPDAMKQYRYYFTVPFQFFVAYLKSAQNKAFCLELEKQIELVNTEELKYNQDNEPSSWDFAYEAAADGDEISFKKPKVSFESEKTEPNVSQSTAV
jgi:hypothetical protein